MTLTPSYVSPVLKTNITVQIAADFPHTLTREKLYMSAVSVDDWSYFRPMAIISVDDDAKSFVAIFGGAYSGQFYT